MSDPFDEVFDLESENSSDDPMDDSLDSITIPKNPSLDDIVQFALKTFKDSVDDSQVSEPKFKARIMEVAGGYLKIAQDALREKEELEQKRRKLEIDEYNAIKRHNPEAKIPQGKTREMILEDLSKER